MRVKFEQLKIKYLNTKRKYNIMIAQPEELNTEKKSISALKFHELRALRREEMNHLDHMHDVYEMLVKVK